MTERSNESLLQEDAVRVWLKGELAIVGSLATCTPEDNYAMGLFELGTMFVKVSRGNGAIVLECSFNNSLAYASSFVLRGNR